MYPYIDVNIGNSDDQAKVHFAHVSVYRSEDRDGVRVMFLIFIQKRRQLWSLKSWHAFVLA
jgi:hypothetical protein